MEQAKSFMDNDDSISKKYQTSPDMISDYTVYTLFLLGMFVSLIYLSQGSDIVTCNPVIECPAASPISRNKSVLIQECDKYRNATSISGRPSNTSYLLVVNFKNINQYKYVNVYCAQKLFGYASVAVPLLFAASVMLFGVGRLWYRLPKVETNLQNLNVLIKEAEKLPSVDLIKDVIEACKALDIGSPPEGTSSSTAKCDETPTSRSLEEQKTERDPLTTRPPQDRCPDITPKEDYFLERQKLADTAAKLQVEHIRLLSSFQDQVLSWKDSLNDYMSLMYVILTSGRMIFVVALIVGNVVVMLKLKMKNEFPCDVTFRYHFAYEKIQCMLNAERLLFHVLEFACFLLAVNWTCSLYTLLWILCKCKKYGRKELNYKLLVQMHSKFQSQKIDLLNKELTNKEKRQIETDIKCPFAKLKFEKGGSSSLPSYTVEEDVSGIPSCLFTKKIDGQDWCLEIKNNVAFEDTDFYGFGHLTGLKELKIINCHSISCNIMNDLRIVSHVLEEKLKNAEDRKAYISTREKKDLKEELKGVQDKLKTAPAAMQNVKNLRIESSVLEEKLQIAPAAMKINEPNDKRETVQSPPMNDCKFWTLPNLTILSLVDIRPFKNLTLEKMDKVTELFISDIAVDETLDFYEEKFPNLKKLTFSNCKMNDTNLTITQNFTNVTDLSVINCGIQKINQLSCNLEFLDLSKNDIRLSKEDRNEYGNSVNEERKPKLQHISLAENKIDSLGYRFLDGFLGKGHLDSFDLAGNQLRDDTILTDISLLYYFGSEEFAMKLLDGRKYGLYEIEEHEGAFLSFDTEVADVEELAVFYCDIEHDETRRRMMLFMSCVAQILKRHDVKVLEGARFSEDDCVLPTSLHLLYVFLAVQKRGFHETLEKIADKVDQLDKVRVYVVVDFEYGTPRDNQDRLMKKETDGKLYNVKQENKFSLVLQRYPLMRHRSLIKQTATRLKRMYVHNMNNPNDKKTIEGTLFSPRPKN